MDKEIKELHAKRGQLKAKITRFKTYLGQFSEGNVFELESRLQKIERVFDEFEEVQDEIESKIPESSEENAERASFENEYFKTVGLAKTVMNAYKPTLVKQELNELVVSPTQLVQLPKINLPTFNGSYERFLSFKETFTSLIDDRKDLAPIQKFHYLRSSLQGEASHLIASLESSSENYILAWELLQNRYENKRLLVTKHLKAIFECERADKESAAKIRNIIDAVVKHLRSLSGLGLPTSSWDVILIYILSQKIDNRAFQDWEKLCSKNELPSLDSFIKFLEKRAELLESLEVERPTNQSSMSSSKKYIGRSSSYHAAVTKQDRCEMCQNNHKLYNCTHFKKLSVNERYNVAKRAELCLNCLRNNHSTEYCQAGCCKICTRKHNTLLHKEANSKGPAGTIVQQATSHATENTNNSQISQNTLSHGKNSTVLLSTAIIKVLDRNGYPVPCRVLLDSGSQSNFITKSLASQLQIPWSKPHARVSGIGANVTQELKRVYCQIKSCNSEYNCEGDFLIIPKITFHLPTINIDISDWPIPEGIALADPRFHTRNKIDMLIGAELFFDILGNERICLGKNLPSLYATKFGWVVTGKADSKSQISRETITCGCSVSLEEQIKQFWKVEERFCDRILSPEERDCERSFEETTTRDSSGRFVVSLPLNDKIHQLGESREIALRRFISLEKRLNKNSKLKETYASFMKEYEALGHMVVVNDEERVVKPYYYLPHHCVTNHFSSTTKLRVVFDGSCKTNSGISLNDTLKVGPIVQQDLISIVIRFREHKYVMTADISKMYRQIKLTDRDCNLHRIFWRENSNEPLRTYNLKTVTYGTASASYLATRCLKQLAIENKDRFTAGSEIVLRDFYVDDLLTGGNTIEEVQSLQREIIMILETGKFPLHKWCANHPAILSSIPIERQEAKYALARSKVGDFACKALGLWWNPNSDLFGYCIKLSESPGSTKRTILAEISSIFDPLGLVGPIIINSKIFIQHLWKLKSGWDDVLPPDTQNSWLRLRQQLTFLENIKIPRRVISDRSLEIELHGFCDASELAYGAAIYVRTVNVNSLSEVQLLCSKSRVAPMKTLSIPRLELCGALLLSHLMHNVKKAMIKVSRRDFLWCDSTVTLAWINSPSRQWKTFVSNRVSEIHDLTVNCEWRHVPTECNPADLLTRGTSGSELHEKKMWWNGPAWLSGSEDQWPKTLELDIEVPEARKCLITTDQSDHLIDMERFSSFKRMIRTMAFVIRFIHNSTARNRNKQKLVGPLSSTEYKSALETLIKQVQQEVFLPEIKALKKKKEIDCKSRLQSLCPFLEGGILRVGGRLSKAQLPYNQKHQIVLPNKHRFTKLLFEEEHKRNLHAGQQLLIATIRQNYWPLGARNIARQVVNNCKRCFRVNPTSRTQRMGELPIERLQPCRPFLNSGVDFCGPVRIKLSHRRGSKGFKAYIALFICMSTKAVHIELVGDLTTQCFLNALKRFIARRGRPHKLFSDNGKNFIGANRELHKNIVQAVQGSEICDFLTEEVIAWEFIPPRAPNFGGLWEAAIKSCKYHFKRVIGEALLTYEEMYTFCTLIESCLNSRPLSPMSSDPNDLNPLTPGHFLTGSALNSVMESDLTQTALSHLTRWQRIQQMLQHFWQRWSKEYISSLQERTKWRKLLPNIVKDQLVLIKEDKLPPLRWKLGRVLEAHPGADGLVRVATIKTDSGIYKRPASSLCLLPSD